MTAPSPTPPHHASAMESAQPPLVRQYLDIVRRRIWIIVSITIIVTCVGAVRAYRTPDMYSAATRILVERQAPKFAFTDPSATDFASWDPDFYSTQAQLLRSQPVLEAAVKDPEIARVLGQSDRVAVQPLSERMKEIILASLGAPPQPVQEPWERLASYISAKPVGGTHFLNISATASDPRTPALLANGIARAFENYIRQSRSDKLGDAFTYLKEEKEREEQKYLLAQEDLQNFREDAKGLDIGDSDSSPAIERLGTLNSRLTSLQLMRAELKSQIVVIREVLKNKSLDTAERSLRLLAVPILKEDGVIQQAHEKVQECERTLTARTKMYGPEHPVLQEAEAALIGSRNEFNDALQRSVLLHANRLQSLLTEEEEITRQYEQQKSVALESAQESFKMARLEMEVDRHRQLYDALAKRTTEIEMSSGFDTTNVQIIEEARVSRSPVGPNRRHNILMSLLLGLAMGIGLAILIETMDDTIKTPEDLKEKLDIPLLGFIPQIRPKANEKAHSRINTLFAVDEPVSSIAEAFRQIRTNLFYSLDTDSAKVVATTSCHPGEGKTTTICNLAAVVAQTGRKVLLIDGDFHRPNVHTIFGIEGSLGLADILSGSVPWREAVISPQRNGATLENLDIIVAGHSSPSASERLTSDYMKQFIKQARDQYDWVLVDSPPLLFVSDASVLSALCDGVILVVKAGMNNRSLLVKTHEHLRQIKVNMLGTILNQMVVSLMGRHYSYYYYHGYSHYSEDYHNAYYGQTPEEKAARAGNNPGRGHNQQSPAQSTALLPSTPNQLTTLPNEDAAVEAPSAHREGHGLPETDTSSAESRQSPVPLTLHHDATSFSSSSEDDSDIHKVKESLDEIEHQHEEMVARLEAILNRKPGNRPPTEPPSPTPSGQS